MKRIALLAIVGLLMFGLGVAATLLLKKEKEIVDMPPGKIEKSTIPPILHGRLSLFVLAGQSNMSGRGGTVALPNTDRVYLFANDYHWKKAREPIDDSDGQVDEVSLDKIVGTGPGLSFATKLAEIYPQKFIGLIPCARGATTMFEWERRLGDDSLYGSCLKRIGAASVMGKVEGILFFQGEWDSFDEKDAQAPIAPNWYPPNKFPRSRISYSADDLKGPFSFNRPSYKKWDQMFQDYVDSMRQDLRSPALPVVFAQIGKQEDPNKYVHWQAVQDIQKSVSMQNVKMIQTADLDLQDKVHFSTQSYLKIGERFAEAYVELIDPDRMPKKKTEKAP